MNIIENHVNYLRNLEERKIVCKTRATICGHSEWDNACLCCGSKITTTYDYCLECSMGLMQL